MGLSIVLPVLDEAGHLEAVLAELARDCPGADIVVVDGGSRDRTLDIAARFPRVRVVSSLRGRARQMNRGGAAAKIHRSFSKTMPLKLVFQENRRPFPPLTMMHRQQSKNMGNG